MKSKVQRYEGKRDFRSEKRRLGFWLVVFSLFSLVVFARLWSIQITHGAEYREIALRQSAGKAPILAPRGAIYDRAGREVAVDVIRHSLCVYPMTQKEAEITGKYLDRLYKRRNGYSRKAHKIQPKRFRWIERGIDDQLALRIKSESPKGVFVREERGRDFPFGLVGKQILGYTDIDNRGISGIESRYDDLLRGVDGVADIQRDGLSKVYRVEERPLLQPSPGSSLILTIDWEFQEIVEEELVKAVNKHNALGGCAAFVDVYTGEILAAAHFDCDEKFPERPKKLKAITDCFEPGSIYKFVMAAAILDERPSLADTSYYCEEGLWLCGTRYLHDDKKHGDLTLREIIELSSNIGTAKLAIELGAESLVRSSQRFGFGQRTRVDFPGEQSGVLHTGMVWSDYNIAALSIGHSVSVTPLQMCMAMAAVANGGELYQPRLTRGSISSKGIASESKKPQKIGRAMKKQSSEILRSYLRGVVTHGTATKVNSNTVAIAGKTGTAEVPRTDGRGYLKNKFVASFAGYFPADAPQVAGIVLLNQPEPIHYGGYTSGPAFRKMAERYSLSNPGRFGYKSNEIEISGRSDEPLLSAPQLVGLSEAAARKIARESGMTLKGAFEDGAVVWQYPSPGEPLTDGPCVVALCGAVSPSLSARGSRAQSDTIRTTPDLTGLSVRQATLLLSRLLIPFEIEGVGTISEQFPTAGSIMDNRQILKLKCLSGSRQSRRQEVG